MARAERPTIIPEFTEDEHIQRRVRYIDERISQNPRRFETVMASVGSSAVAESIELNSNRTPTLKRSAKDLLSEYLSQRYDYESTYDPETETLLGQDEHFKELQDMQRKSKGKSGQEALVRDEMRQYRLSFFIGQAVLWREQTASSDQPQPTPALHSVG